VDQTSQESVVITKIQSLVDEEVHELLSAARVLMGDLRRGIRIENICEIAVLTWIFNEANDYKQGLVSITCRVQDWHKDL
jgi:hypothetical protein